MTYLNNVVQLENPFDTEFLKKMIGVWIGNMVKRRTVVGPPLSARMRDMLQKKAYILIRSYSIVPKEISVKVQFNRLFPDQVEQDAVKIIHEKAKDIKVEVDQEMMSFLNIEGDDKSWLPALSDLQRSGGEDSEPFIHYPGKFVIYFFFQNYYEKLFQDHFYQKNHFQWSNLDHVNSDSYNCRPCHFIFENSLYPDFIQILEKSG